MTLSLKNPWPVVTPNLKKKISTSQKIANENFATEFISIKRFCDDLLGGYQPFDHLVLAGSLTTKINTTTTNYTLTDLDQVLLVDSTGGVVTVTLPSAVPTKGKLYSVKDWKGQSATHNITIATTGGQTIDGGATKVLNTAYVSYEIVSDGANWAII